jgi:hypothetical protein
MPRLVEAITAETHADYSQFSLASGHRWVDPDALRPEWSVGLAQGDGLGCVLLVAMRQFGVLPVRVELWDEAPLAPDWGDVVEVPFDVTGPLRVAGWAENSHDALSFVAEGAYRLRYAIDDAAEARGVFDPPYPEKYLLQLWPQQYAAPKVVRRDTANGRYWQASWQMGLTAPGQHTTSDAGVILAGIDAALAADPDSAARIRAGEHEFTIAISPLVPWIPMERRQDFDIPALIIERASR